MALAVALPFSPLGAWFGFVPLPVAVLLALAAVTAVYLIMAEQVKRCFLARALTAQKAGPRD